MKKKYKVKNLCCADCARQIEEKIKEIDGVEYAKLNFLMQKMTIEAKDEDLDRILDEALSIARKIDSDVEII